MSSDLARWRLIGAAAAGAVVLPGTAEAATKRPAAKKRKPRSADVVVIGAGLSGLMAAREVAAAGRSVLVLEARGRVGGRTFNRTLESARDTVVEIGGQWVGPTQDVLLALARTLGVDTYPTYDTGDYLFHRNGTSTRYTTDTPLGAIPPDVGAAEAFAAITSLDAMAATLPLDAPWTAPRAGEWDSRRSRPGSSPTPSVRGRGCCSTSSSRRSGRPSRATSRSCTS